MERIKRQHIDIACDYNNNKKQKIENKNKSYFENLANETIYEIFDYLDIYHIYQGFSKLNNRFTNLITHSNLRIQIDLSKIPKRNFDYYHKNIILPNKHRINYFRLSNPFTVDIIFSPPSIISKYSQLETLIFNNINAKYLPNILQHAIILPKLSSLTLTLIDYIEHPSKIFFPIFHLPNLKSFQITYQIKDNDKPLSIFLGEYKPSSIEYLSINARIRYESIDTLLNRLPKLRYLSINSLVGKRTYDISPSLFPHNYLKSVSLKLDGVTFDQFKKLVQYYFQSIETLKLTTRFHQPYLYAQRWEELIKSSLPNLHIFDFKHLFHGRENDNLFHDLIRQFHTSFWIKNQWFFTHQHDWQENIGSGIFYSTEPYRRKDYEFYWEFNKQICSHAYENNLNSVKHVQIESKHAKDNSVNYFSNATELTIGDHFSTPDDTISTTLQHIVPLEQLTKLVFGYFQFPFEEIIQILNFTPNLYTLKIDHLITHDIDLNSFEKSDNFQNVLKMNRIKILEIRVASKLPKIELIMKLFTKIISLEIGIDRKELEQIIRHILIKQNTTVYDLHFLCLLRMPKICLKELNRLFQKENLLDNYLMKFIQRDLYLWW